MTPRKDLLAKVAGAWTISMATAGVLLAIGGIIYVVTWAIELLRG